MRRAHVSLGIIIISFSLVVLGLPNAPTAQALTTQLVSGRAVDSDGQPIGGLPVQLFDQGADPSQDGPINSTVTTGSGTYEITAPTPGEINNPYNLVLGRGSDYAPVTTPVDVLAGADLAVGDTQLNLIYATGKVSNYKGQPVKGVRVSSHVRSEGTWEWFSGDETTLTDAAGNYRVQLKPLARYTVKFDITDVSWVYLGGSSEAPGAGDPIATRDGAVADVTGLDVQLPETHKLKASVATPYGETVVGAFVALYGANHEPGDDILFSLEEVSNGRFEADVPPGAYDLVVDASGASPNVQSITRKISLAAELDLGKLALGLSDPSISGSVYDKYGSPLAGARATRLSGDAQDGTYTAEGAVLLTRADGGFGWSASASRLWTQVEISLATCPTLRTSPVDLAVDSLVGGIRLACGTQPVATRPTITGSPIVGSTLTAGQATAPSVFVRGGVEWLRDGVVIASGPGTYKVTNADVGHQLTVRQSFRRPPVEGFAGLVIFDTFTLTSVAAGTVVLPLTLAPVPKISGKATIGSRLTAKPGTWAPSPVPLKYQWLRSGTAIPGATASTYKVQKADAGATIALRVTAAKAGYVKAVKTSSATAKVPFLKLKAGTAKISGTAKVGKLLKASKGKWKPSGITFGYQWFVGKVAVPGATKTSYRPVASDKGKSVTVKITGSKVGYKAVTKTSKATKKVS